MLLWDRYSQILWPRRHLPKLADGLCRNSDIRICLDPHVIWQPTKSYVERCNAFRLIAHRCLPFFVRDHLSQSSETVITYSGVGSIIISRPACERKTSQICSEISKVCSSTADYVRFTPKSGHWDSAAQCPLYPQKRTHAPQQTAAYSITSSARASSAGGTSSPNVLAVCRLMTSSNLVGSTTGRSAGFSPLRTRPVYTPTRRNSSVTFGP